MRKGGGSMFKMRILTLAVTAAPFALFLARLALGSKHGMSDGGFA
jgi:hypothetical protein